MGLARQSVLAAVAVVALAGCAADPVWAPDDAVQRAVYANGAGPSLTLYTVLNTESGSGEHSALMVNSTQRVLFDPSGSFRHPQVPERNDVLFGYTETIEKVYIDYHARESYDVRVQSIAVPAEVARRALAAVQDYGAVPNAQCSLSISRILSDLPGFEALPVSWFPKTTADNFARLTGVEGRRVTDDDADSDHGVRFVPVGTLQDAR